MKISEIIEVLEDAKKAHGDLPVCTFDSDIGEVELIPCRDGIQQFENGVMEAPNEFVLELHPKKWAAETDLVRRI